MQTLSIPGDLAADLKELLEEMKKQAAHRDRPSMIDNKGVGKPTTFSGEEAKFIEWNCKTEDWILGAWP